MRDLLISICLAVCLVLGFGGLAQAERPITILMLDARSGPAKSLGDRYLLAMQFAADEQNQKGGLLGRKVQVIAEDSQIKPEVAVRKAQKYVLQGKVDILTVMSGSHVAKAVKNLATSNNLIFVNYTMSDVATGKEFAPNSVRLVYPSSMIARALVAYIAQKKDFTKFYLLNQDYSYGRDMAASLKKELARQIPKSQVVGEDYHPLFTKDFSPLLSKIKASGAQCILTANWGPDISILVKQRSELGVKAVIANNAMTDPLVLKELGNMAVGSIVSGVFIQTQTNPAAKEFMARWKEAHASGPYPLPDNICARTYVGTKFLFAGIAKAGSIATDKVIKAMEGMEQESVDGTIRLRACDHQLLSPLPAAEVVSGSPPYCGPVTMLPISVVEIPKASIDNPRCCK